MSEPPDKTNPTPPVCLTIAGSDSSGGAGIQGDLKAFAALGVYGASAITALTAQNTVGVQGILPIDPAFVRRQIASVFDDLPVRAVKTGMLATVPVIAAVAGALAARPEETVVVVDPVMIARSGDVLLDADAIQSLRSMLLPLATVITPNRHEAALLAGTPAITDVESLRRTARALFDLIGRPVLVKGGSILPGALDLLIDGHGDEFPMALDEMPIATTSTHGTGCAFSAALCGLLALGHPLRQAAAGAKQYVGGAIRHAPGLGRGHGPIDHAWLGRHAPRGS